jgi:hypothetical protein
LSGHPRFFKLQYNEEKKMGYKNLISMPTKILMLLAFAGLILIGGCKNTQVQSHWSAEPVKVDGEMTEWPSGSTVYFEDSGVQLGLRNDSQNLYILFRFGNQAWARAIRMGGLTLWLDDSGKKNKDFGIRYAGGPSPSEMQKMEMPNRGGFLDSLTPEQQQRLIDMQTAAAHQIIVINKKSDQEITISADGSSGPSVSFGSPQGTYTYEFSIPLQKSDVSHYGIGAQSGQAICLGLEWGGISDGDRQRMMHKGSGGMEGGPPGGMRGGREGRHRGGPGMQPTEKQEIWVKTQLASPPAE